MKIINEFPFTYKNNQLFCEDVPVNEIIKETDTPVYIYSKNYFKEQFLKFQNAFRSIDKKIFFACKSNFNLNVIKIFSDLVIFMICEMSCFNSSIDMILHSIGSEFSP